MFSFGEQQTKVIDTKYVLQTVNLWSGIFIQMCMQPSPTVSMVEGYLNPGLFNPVLFNPVLFNPWTFQPQIFQPWTFQLQLFNHEALNHGIEKFFVEKSEFEKAKVEAWGWKVRGWDVLQPNIENIYKYCWPLIVLVIIPKINQDPNFMIDFFWKW